jgi:sporulation protein YlmC with PRC-barrel domain
LIAARKVNGTTVYNTEGEKLGSVCDVVIDKRSGKAQWYGVGPTILFSRMTGFLRHEGDKTQCQRIAI